MDNANVAANDLNGIVNGIHKFVKDIDVRLNGKKVCDCNDANHPVNIKNLLEYSPIYSKSTATNEFFFQDTSAHAEPSSTSSQLQCRLLGTKENSWCVICC